jgi:uncharacterized protein YndB with AHSA1/START domain
MATIDKLKISVQVKIVAPPEKVWKCWTDPVAIAAWNQASDDWHTTRAENDLRAGGKFLSRMEAKDGSTGFNFEGTYDEVITCKKISYTMGDGRKVSIDFIHNDGVTEVVETFDAEDIHPAELQRAGWQSILDNFRKYTEREED